MRLKVSGVGVRLKVNGVGVRLKVRVRVRVRDDGQPRRTLTPSTSQEACNGSSGGAHEARGDS